MVILSSCSDYGEIQTSVDLVQEFNKGIEAARLNNEEWANSPEDIARNMFPAASHEGGDKKYGVNKKSTPGSTCTVTVLDAGPTDDEVYGEHRTLALQAFQGKWKIMRYRYAVKRRE